MSLSPPRTSVRLSQSALLHNLREFRRFVPVIAPVVKSNAYGHGLKEVIEMLSLEAIPFLVVDSFDEAKEIRSYGSSIPILTLGYVAHEDMNSTALKDISYTLISREMVEEWAKYTSIPTRVHVKVDTGMNRQGIAIAELKHALTRIRSNPVLSIEGLCTHLADADSNDVSYTKAQIQAWNDCVCDMEQIFGQFRYVHIANTAGHAFQQRIRANMSRLGIGLYGFTGNGLIDSRLSLKPVMSVETFICGTKEVPSGSGIGYNKTFVAPHPMRLATIPIGYAGGVDRRLSNIGSVLIDNTPARILGRVSMNITTLDITHIPRAQFCDPVTILSNDSNQLNSVVSVARMIQTNPHDIACAIHASLPRYIY